MSTSNFDTTTIFSALSQVHLSSAQQSDEFFNSSDQLRRLTSFQNSALTSLQADYDEVTLEDGEQLLLKLQVGGRIISMT